MKKDKKQILSIYIDEKTKKVIRKLAQEKYMPTAAYIRLVICEHANQNNK